MKGKKAIVTGASSGIGKAAAIALADKNYDVAIGYVSNRDAALAAAGEVEQRGVKAKTFKLDLAEPETSAAILQEVIDLFQGVDVFVNNAGINRRASILEETLEDWERVMTVNATGPFVCAQVAARNMVSHGRGGRIINVTSVHEMIPILGGASYCASKAALGLLTKVMALELAQYGITVNSISPGETATPMNGVPENRDARTIRRPKIPMGRPALKEEVAGIIAYLAEPAAAYITGVSMTVDGGLSLMSAIPNQEYADQL